ncbi:MAG TPA: Kdo hydroxylase family protein [Candidatus Acidoferrales bacterium]|nr:Kdo hydroxylase family protein [Candidatus Acidoferrales bacterium]
MTLAAGNRNAGTAVANPDWVSRRIEVSATSLDTGGAAPAASAASARTEKSGSGRYAEELERGNILFFPRSPFPLSEEDKTFLLAQRQADAGYHKNIAYRPAQDRLTGAGKLEAPETAKLKKILRAYSDWATQFLGELIPEYAGNWTKDFASYRAIEEQGRSARLTARNDLAHVDAFPSRPTHGDRILRVFTNLNPAKSRVWVTSETFEGLAGRFAQQVGIPKAPRAGAQTFAQLAGALGMRQWARSPYDAFMLRFHDFLKQNSDFQQNCAKQHWEFPPGSCWICYTDMVSHAVLSGQFALEQTFLISRHAMALPEKAPIRILERICGHPLSG